MLNSKIGNSQRSSILIIEDHPMTLDVFKTKLEIEGYHVDLASDGMVGLEKALTINPDLVLLDLMLPRLNGLEVLAELRKNPKTKKTPIIILSNWENDEDIKKGLELGANDFLLKSNITPKEVVRRIKGLLPTSSTEDEFLSIPTRYHVNIQTAQGSASQLAEDYAFNEAFSCAKCNNTITLDLMPDETFIGRGHRFFAQFVCTNCREVY
jgi:DNA-binding response OmpR family regulator